MNYPFPVDPVLTAISISYRNKRLVADEVLPRRPVAKTDFRYLKHDLSEGFTIPNTQVGRKSAPGEVSFTATEVRDSTEDYALDDPVPFVDIDNAPKGYNPVDHSVITITHLILLDREIRVAGMVFDQNTYPAANKVQLAGADQFSDYDNSTPLEVITDALEACILRPNVMVIGREAFNVLSQHPHIVKAVHGNDGDKGIARREDIAKIFDIDKVIVGEGKVNVANKGQPVDLRRVWGKHISLLYTGAEANGMQETIFGFTAEYGSRVSGSEKDSKIGMRGGLRVRVGESVKEVISAPDLGYFIEDAVA